MSTCGRNIPLRIVTGIIAEAFLADSTEKSTHRFLFLGSFQEPVDPVFNKISLIFWFIEWFIKARSPVSMVLQRNE